MSRPHDAASATPGAPDDRRLRRGTVLWAVAVLALAVLLVGTTFANVNSTLQMGRGFLRDRAVTLVRAFERALHSLGASAEDQLPELVHQLADEDEVLGIDLYRLDGQPLGITDGDPKPPALSPLRVRVILAQAAAGPAVELRQAQGGRYLDLWALLRPGRPWGRRWRRNSAAAGAPGAEGEPPPWRPGAAAGPPGPPWGGGGLLPGPPPGAGPGHMGLLLHLRYSAEPLDHLRAQAWLHAGAVGAGLAALLALLGFGFAAQRKSLRLQRALGEQERLAGIGTLSAVLAHEIRNPLAAVKGHAQLSLEDLPPEHELREGLEIIVSESTRLEALVGNLLDFARPRQFEPVFVAVAPLLQRLWRLREPEFRSRGAQLALLEADPELGVWADADAVEQALHNLLGNALQAVEGRAGGRVELGAARQGEEVCLWVADNGPGVPAELAPNIFNPYVTGRARGTGLGLAVVAQVADALGGRALLENSSGAGARFELRLRPAS